RGELFPVGSYGHTGFTGTSLWLDPATRSYVIFLSNRVHPDGKGDVTALRGKVATVAAAALISSDDVAQRQEIESAARRRPALAVQNDATASARRAADGSTLTGLDVLVAEHFARLRGRRVGLVTNQTGVSSRGESAIDLLAHAPGVTLVALFSPEHGIRGLADDKVASSRDAKTGLPIHSLYGTTLRPTDAMLQGIDTLVVDLQDIGA